MKKYFFCLLLISVSKTHAQSIVETLIPKPLSVQETKGTFLFNGATQIIADAKHKSAVQFLKSFLAKNMDFKPLKVTSNLKSPKVLITEKDADNLKDEAYRLTITPQLITINAKGAGVFYAIQTLIQLFPNQPKNNIFLPCVKIIDEPRFAYRGLMLDVSRHFFNVAQIKDLLDLMAVYKLNRFHWHLTDDQGWRIEIKSFPKLTSVGSWRVPRKDFGMEPPRPNEVPTDGGYYTQEQIREIVRYATERHIEIMPEIDVPGHSMAAIAAYPELSVTKNKETKVNPGSSFAKWFPTGGFEMYVDNTLNPTDEKVYDFLDKVFGEVASLFPYEYIHIGGDECFKGFWEKDQDVKGFMTNNNIKDMHGLQSYFTERVSKIVRSKNKKAIGWDEIFDKDKDQEIAIMNRFGEVGAAEQAKKKLKLIMAPGGNGLYFDYAQSYSEMEPSSHGQFSPTWKAYNYTADYSKMDALDKEQILGVQACIWTEAIPSVAKLEYMLLPRLLALSETAWSAAANKDYERFKTATLPTHLQRFDQKGLNFRVPTVFENTDTVMIGKEFNIELKSQVPGSKIFYTLNNRFPSDADHLYKEPIQLKLADNKKYILKTVVVTPSGKRSVVTRTVLYNPIIKKSIQLKSTNIGLKFKLIDLENVNIGTGVVTLDSLGQFESRKNTSLKMQGYVYIPKDGYYEFSADQKLLDLSVSGNKVVDMEKPYPKFDKLDPLYLQKGYHAILIEQSQVVNSPLKIYRKELNKETIEIWSYELVN